MEIIDSGVHIIPKGAEYKEFGKMLVVMHPDFSPKMFAPGAIVFSEEDMKANFNPDFWGQNNDK